MRYPPIEPFRTGQLSVPGGELYFELSGNPDGIPALHLHGGPGVGLLTGHRRRFDPERFCVVALDQRGCGRSTPNVADDLGSLIHHTPARLTADLEALREHLGIARWLVSGVSWGSTLALSYAAAHPERITALALMCICTTDAPDVAWVTESMRALFPAEWEAFAAASGARPGQKVIDAYRERIVDPDPTVREAAARAWCRWEDTHISLGPDAEPDPRYEDPRYRATFATLVIHCWQRADWVDRERLRAARSIPLTMIHGRRDVSSPLASAYDIHRSWPGSELVVVEDEGHGGPKMVAALEDAIARLAR